MADVKYWKANKEMSQRIQTCLKSWTAVLRKAHKVKTQIGANAVYTSNGFSTQYVSGFLFDDESAVDKKQFCRLEKAANGWRPRANTALSKEMKTWKSDCLGDIMQLIGMKMFGPGGTIRNPGVVVCKGVAYLVLPDDVTKPTGCARIADVAYEKAVKRK